MSLTHFRNVITTRSTADENTENINGKIILNMRENYNPLVILTERLTNLTVKNIPGTTLHKPFQTNMNPIKIVVLQSPMNSDNACER